MAGLLDMIAPTAGMFAQGVENRNIGGRPTNSQFNPSSFSTSSLASQGRYGDTELAHVEPWEKELLTELGGANTINPNTGLREFYYEYDEDEEYDIDTSGGFASDAQEGYKYYADKLGISEWWRDESYAEEQQREKYIEHVEDTFTSQIGDFKDMDFANMSQSARNAAVKRLMGTHVSDDDLEKYYNQYDWEKEEKARREGSEEILQVGERSQGDLEAMGKKSLNRIRRGGFARTGQPQLDRYRENIFKGIGLEQKHTYRSLLDAVDYMETDYNDAIIAAAYGHKTGLIEDA